MTDITRYASQQQTDLERASRTADEMAHSHRLENYQREKSPETLRRHKADIDLFTSFLNAIRVIPTGDMLADIAAWRGISMGIVEGFREWMLQQGYSIGSINVRLSTVKVYARIAFESGVIFESSYRLIQTVKGFKGKEARNVDEKRSVTRVGSKKQYPTMISVSHMKSLKEILEKDTSPTGKRDFLLVCLLGYQGLRCGEVAALQRSNLDLENGDMIFYRRKVNKVQRHEFHPTTLQAVRRYLESVQTSLYLFEGVTRKAWTDKNGKAHKGHTAEDGLSTRAINSRIREVGGLVGIQNLSPHDLRHYWTFDAFKQKTPIDIIMEAGGWNTYAMPMHYRGQSRTANEGIRQSE